MKFLLLSELKTLSLLSAPLIPRNPIFSLWLMLMFQDTLRNKTSNFNNNWKTQLTFCVWFFSSLTRKKCLQFNSPKKFKSSKWIAQAAPREINGKVSDSRWRRWKSSEIVWTRVKTNVCMSERLQCVENMYVEWEYLSETTHLCNSTLSLLYSVV